MEYDLIVIGAGPGGYVAAIKAAQEGLKVALVERDALGGVCLNWGCIPTKALLKSAQVFSHCKEAANYGVDIAGSVAPNMERIVARSRSVAENMSKGVSFLLNKNGVEVINGCAKVVESNLIEVNGEQYAAKNIILATGARPRELPNIPLDHKHVINSKDALSLSKLPASIAVIGSGAIGSEFAYLFATLGSKVTIIEYMPHLMPLEDEEVSKAMERSFRKLRMQVLTSTKVSSVTVTDNGTCQVETEGKKGVITIEADVVLSAVGIKSNIENLWSENINIELKGDKIAVDKNYQTSQPNIYAIGDIIATPALAHVASAEAIACVEHICSKNPKAIDYTTVPSCIFTSPEVSSVGLTEAQVAEQGVEYSVGRFPFTASGKAAASGERDGFVKLIFDSDKKLLGAHFVGGNVAELISEPTLAKSLGATAEQITSTIHAHPSLNEAIMEAAEAALGKAIHI